MASQTELRLRITEVLRDLEKKKSNLQIQLNLTVDPMARMPLEISSDIFLRCLPQDHPIPFENYAPLVFLNVCHSWTDIALATPALWDTMDVIAPRRVGFPQLMKLWFSRARNRPLSICLSGTLDTAIRSVVHRNTSRLLALELFFPSGRDLKKMTTSFSSESLTTLTISQGVTGQKTDINNEYVYSQYPSECVKMLLAAPQLVECTLDHLCYGHYSVGCVSIHPSLKHLRFRGCATNSLAVLHYLTLPALETLAIPHFSMEYDPFLDFLLRSAPPLRVLRMVTPEEWRTDSTTIRKICRLVPSLEELEVHPRWVWGAEDTLINLLDALAVTLQECLPNLRKVILSLSDYAPSRTVYESLVNVISARRGTLEVFTLRGDLSPPDADIIAPLRQLVIDGMEIFIGQKDQNYI
ncbi:hypothetical protein C8R43DRAFT_943685 [Mycena crocata]|nr:hypothetical protein C8R43DRAFT_943685 [Mycena crocata]